MILRAAWVWLGPGKGIPHAEIEVRAGRVVAVRRSRARTVPPRLLSPGLVDAHCHLQLAALPAKPWNFTDWIGAVIAAGRASSAVDRAARLRAALARLRAEGTVAFGEIDSTGESPALLREAAVRGRCYQEVLGFDLSPAAARSLVKSRALPGSRACPSGFSPHAPYSTSAALFLAVARTRRAASVHVAEIPEEAELLHRGRGSLRDLLERLGRLPPGWRAPGCSSVAWLARAGLLSSRCSLIHAQHLEPGDEERIRAARAPVVVCPGTIRYFAREAPPVPRWLARGIAVGLGTDSLASNSELSMRRELTLAARAWPDLAPEALWSMATVHGARALALGSGLAVPWVEVEVGRGESLDAVLAALCAGERTVRPLGLEVEPPHARP